MLFDVPIYLIERSNQRDQELLEPAKEFDEAFVDVLLPFDQQ